MDSFSNRNSDNFNHKKRKTDAGDDDVRHHVTNRRHLLLLKPTSVLYHAEGLMTSPYDTNKKQEETLYLPLTGWWFCNKIYNNYNYLIGQNCRKSDLLPKILSTKIFCQLILTGWLICNKCGKHFREDLFSWKEESRCIPTFQLWFCHNPKIFWIMGKYLIGEK